MRGAVHLRGAQPRLGRRGRPAGGATAARATGLLTVVAALVAVALMSPALAGCGDDATDANEPNDELNSATTLVPGEPMEGVVGSDDADVFSCEAPGGRTVDSFVVTVQTEAPQDIELQVGASIPGVWEGITWPGWEAVTKDGRLELAGELRKGTVLVFLKAASGSSSDISYSIDIAWE